MEETMYKVTLVAYWNEYTGYHNDKLEAALAALAKCNEARAEEAWDSKSITSLVCLSTFDTFEQVEAYWLSMYEADENVAVRVEEMR